MPPLLSLLVLSLLVPVHVTEADDARVLPQGRWRVSAEARFSLPITRRFTPSGGTEDIATDFNRALTSTVFSDLRLVETAFRLPAGSASFGRSVVDFERRAQVYQVQAAYGLTNRLSLGVRIPYWHQTIAVEGSVDTRTATVGFNPAVPGGVAPLGVPGTRRATSEDMQAFLGRLGFRRVDDWSATGFGDILSGLKYQYYQSASWRLAASGTVRFPTGRWDDPNNLVDVPTGFEAWGLGLQLHQDFLWLRPGRTAQHGVLSTGAMVLSTTFRYEIILPDTKPFRVCDVHQPICPDFDPEVRRDVGDILEAEVGGTVGLLPGLTLTPTYTYTHKFQDQFDGDRGFDYRQLRQETDFDTHGLEVRLGYSTAALVAAKRFPLPLSVALQYTERFAGTNNRVHTRYLGCMLTGIW